MRQLTKQRCRDATSSLVLTFQPNHLYICMYINGRKRQINYKFIPTSLFRGRPDEWATTKQACRDELVVYLSFSSIYTTLYFYVLSTVLRKSSFTLYVCIYIYICVCVCAFSFPLYIFFIVFHSYRVHTSLFSLLT